MNTICIFNARVITVQRTPNKIAYTHTDKIDPGSDVSI